MLTALDPADGRFLKGQLEVNVRNSKRIRTQIRDRHQPDAFVATTTVEPVAASRFNRDPAIVFERIEYGPRPRTVSFALETAVNPQPVGDS